MTFPLTVEAGRPKARLQTDPLPGLESGLPRQRLWRRATVELGGASLFIWVRAVGLSWDGCWCQILGTAVSAATVDLSN